MTDEWGIRRELRDTREGRTIPVQNTGLFHGAMIEISRLGRIIATKDHELARLRRLLAEHGIDEERTGTAA